MHIREVYYVMIKNGKKRVDWRTNDPDRQLVDVDDTIVFVCLDHEDRRLSYEVIRRTEYNTIRAKVEGEWHEALLPNTTSNEEAVAVYYGINEYRQREDIYGIKTRQNTHTNTCS